MVLAEITSGGIAAMRFSALDPAGEVFLGSVVPAAGTARAALLGVPAETLGTPAAAKALAEAVRQTFGADIGLATTGQHDTGEAGAAGRRIVWLTRKTPDPSAKPN